MRITSETKTVTLAYPTSTGIWITETEIQNNNPGSYRGAQCARAPFGVRKHATKEAALSFAARSDRGGISPMGETPMAVAEGDRLLGEAI